MLYLGPMHKLQALNRALRSHRERSTAHATAAGVAGPHADQVRATFEEAVMWEAEAAGRYAYCGCRAASRLPSLSNHVLVLPEVWTHYLDVIGGEEVRKVLWWLSVDNNGGSFKAFSETAARGVVHASNSHYGLDYLARHGIAAAAWLPDYIHSECRGEGQRHGGGGAAARGGALPRDHLVVYNPSKGTDDTRRILAALAARTDARRAAAREAGKQAPSPVLLVPVQHVNSSAPLLSRARVSRLHTASGMRARRMRVRVHQASSRSRHGLRARLASARAGLHRLWTPPWAGPTASRGGCLRMCSSHRDSRLSWLSC